MGDRLIISDNREDPGNPLVFDGEAIDAAARNPMAIGKLLPEASAQRLVDQDWAEGTDPTSGGLCDERNSHQPPLRWSSFRVARGPKAGVA
jgi:hypothetical protein